jgi:hypothetical protein
MKTARELAIEMIAKETKSVIDFTNIIEARDKEAAQACAKAAENAWTAPDEGGTCHLSDITDAILAAVNPPDPRREALGRKLYEKLNPDGTPWDEHGEPMHERYRAAAEAVRDG